MRTLVLVSVLALSSVVSFADTLMTLDDVEGSFASWSKMQPVTSPVHSGGHAWPEDLERLKAANAAKQSYWVHTDMQAPPGPEEPAAAAC